MASTCIRVICHHHCPMSLLNLLDHCGLSEREVRLRAHFNFIGHKQKQAYIYRKQHVLGVARRMGNNQPQGVQNLITYVIFLTIIDK